MLNVEVKWMEEGQERGITVRKKKNFYDYTYRDLCAGIKKLLGRDDDRCVIFLFQDPELLRVLFEGQWVRIYFDQVERFLPQKS